MSLADHIRLLRAQQGGMGFEALAERLGAATAKEIFKLERKQRDLADEAMLEKLAVAFQVPIEELRQDQAHSRKALGAFCLDAQEKATPVTLHLRHGEALTGQVLWLDMAAIGLQGSPDQIIVVQRHAVTDWELTIDD